MQKILALVVLIALTGCLSTQPTTSLPAETLDPTETGQVDALLKKLYQSFSYGEGEEPNWELMRSVFVENAQFVTETPAGEEPNPQTVDDFISSWQASIRGSTTPRPAHDEWITSTMLSKVGQLIRVDVEFQARKQKDPAPRKPGLDSLVLVQVDDSWKVLSFVVQYESKL